MRQVKFFTVLLLSFLFLQVNADVKLPRILSSNMVLQRNAEFKIWGWADKNEKVTVTFNGVTRKAKTGPSLAPFWWRLTAIGREPMQQMGRAVPTIVE